MFSCFVSLVVLASGVFVSLDVATFLGEVVGIFATVEDIKVVVGDVVVSLLVVVVGLTVVVVVVVVFSVVVAVVVVVVGRLVVVGMVVVV